MGLSTAEDELWVVWVVVRLGEGVDEEVTGAGTRPCVLRHEKIIQNRFTPSKETLNKRTFCMRRDRETTKNLV